jgi:hypothetical protein
MPLALGAQIAPPPDMQAGPNTPGPADIPGARWIDPLGNVWPLTQWDLGWFTTTGVKGLGAAPVTITTDPMPRGGVKVRNVQPAQRLITWPLYVEGADHTTFITRWRQLAKAFTMTRRRGPGTLVITRPDGTERAIKAWYQDGYDGDPDGGTRWDVCALTLLCEAPYFTDLVPTLITRAYAVAGGSYLSPYPSVSTSQTLGATVAFVPGSVEVWPDWTITGPASSIVVTNNDTGETWTLDATGYRGTPLVAGETVTVHTDPASVIGPDGSVWIGAINFPTATLFGLPDGASNLTFTINGAAAGSSISASFYARHETA